ncbi:MAG TPA: hypothetical protein VGR31_10690 [Planctomycetota bacterium]|nr:hypothetical protein [Planctomycetota bacterium]
MLLHRVGNASQLLTALDGLLEVDPRALETRSGDLVAAGETVDEIGWLLALLASASGARLLLDRRERGGLVPVVACVRACLRREGRDLAAPARALPGLAPDVGEGWQLPWGVGSLLYLAGRTQAPRAALAWTVAESADGWSLACPAPQSDDAALFERWVAKQLAPARFLVDDAGCALGIPRAWLRSPP